VQSVIFRPDGRSALTVGEDGRVIVWNTESGTPATVLAGSPERVREASVSPTGATLYTAEVGGEVLAWDLTGASGFGRRARVGQALPCCDPISPPSPPLARSPDGTRFAVPLGPASVGVFSTQTLRRQERFAIQPPGDSITALAWSPSGSTLAVGAHGGVVQLWSVSGKPRFERSLAGLAPAQRQPEAIHGLAFSPDGTVLVASDESQTTSLGRQFPFPFATMAKWRVATGQLLGPPSDLGAGNTLTGSDALAFSPDRRLLAVTELAGDVRIYEAGTGRLLRTLGDRADHSISLAFAPNGTLAVGTLGDTVELWNPYTGKLLAPPLLADSAPITAIAFDPTGQRFITAAAQTGSVKLWSTAGLQQEGPRLTSDPGSSSAGAFGPVGDSLLVVDDRGGAFTWPMSLAVWEQRACSLAGRNLTRARWAQFVGSPRYATVCNGSSR
jgi:WD40 repeat protein